MARLIKRPQFKWDRELDVELCRLVLEEGKTAPECARLLNKDLGLIKKQLRRLKILKAATRKKAGSKGQRKLEDIIKEVFPHDVVKVEEHLYDRLFLDVWVPQRRIGFEYQGRQHDELIAHFHEDQEAFLRQQERDRKKKQLCDENNITLICVHWTEPLTAEHINERIVEALNE